MTNQEIVAKMQKLNNETLRLLYDDLPHMGQTKAQQISNDLATNLEDAATRIKRLFFEPSLNA